MEVMSIEVGALLVAFHLKHILVASPTYGKESYNRNWKELALFPPNALLHGLTTLLISSLITKDWSLSLKMALIDFVIHFLVGFVKVGLNFRALTNFERTYYRKAINKAVAEDSVYDCFNYETSLMERERESTKFWLLVRLSYTVHYFSYYAFIYTILLTMQK